MTLTLELQKAREAIEIHAKEYGLDFFETVFEVLDWNQINMVAAYGGFPNRYPHWRFGMEYERLSKSYSYGLSKIYEMVINNDPCYAYLLHSNKMVDQKMVMAHVFAHCDFFKNNAWFKKTNRKMMDEMANHRVRVQRYMDSFGYEVVESFIDACLSLENLIDTHRGTPDRRPETYTAPDLETKKLKSFKPYMDKYVNPPEFLAEQQKEIQKEVDTAKKNPVRPDRDVMGFLMNHAPLQDWERDIVSIIREEAYYFAPQGQTKILNEGWASFWHSKMMTEKIMTDSDLIDFADHHSGTVAMQPGQLNPYKIGIELLRHIKERWDKGQFGKEWAECNDMRVRKEWDKKLGLGMKKIFEVRALYNDVMFIDEFLTPEFCAEQKLFVFAFNVTADRFEVASREFDKIKKQLLFQLTNFGQPIIYVQDANHKGAGEMLLKHAHEGVDIQMDWGRETMKALYSVWRKPIHLQTFLDDVPKTFSFDGKDYSETRA